MKGIAGDAEINDVVKRYSPLVPTICILNYARAVADQRYDIEVASSASMVTITSG